MLSLIFEILIWKSLMLKLVSSILKVEEVSKER